MGSENNEEEEKVRRNEEEEEEYRRMYIVRGLVGPRLSPCNKPSTYAKAHSPKIVVLLKKKQNERENRMKTKLT